MQKKKKQIMSPTGLIADQGSDMGKQSKLHGTASSKIDPNLMQKLERVMEQAAALNPDASGEYGRKSVGQMTPEEMIDTLNVYI